jgi:hypothetical protein
MATHPITARPAPRTLTGSLSEDPERVGALCENHGGGDSDAKAPCDTGINIYNKTNHNHIITIIIFRGIKSHSGIILLFITRTRNILIFILFPSHPYSSPC